MGGAHGRVHVARLGLHGRGHGRMGFVCTPNPAPAPHPIPSNTRRPGPSHAPTRHNHPTPPRRNHLHPPQEVSGYIDYGHRLKTENCEPYFDRKKRLMPRPSDLSFYNWETQMSTSNPTPNFQVGARSEEGGVARVYGEGVATWMLGAVELRRKGGAVPEAWLERLRTSIRRAHSPSGPARSTGLG